MMNFNAVKVTFFVPMQDNNKVHFPRPMYIEAIEQDLLTIFEQQGFTRSIVEGGWTLETGETIIEPMASYVVVLAAADFDVARWRAYKDDLKARFGQEEIYMTAEPILNLMDYAL